MRQYYQGKFQPKNPSKYAGNPNEIVYRSAWELKVMIGFDTHPSIVEWSSEELIIPYFWEGDGKMHRYFPDFKIKAKTSSGVRTILIEVKPFAQTLEPVMKKGKKKKTFVNEVETYSKNQAKWAAAREYCLDRGWTFQVVTEKEIFKQKSW